MTYQAVMAQLQTLADPKKLAMMTRHGITTELAYGVSLPNIRAVAKQIGQNHQLAHQLWASGVHEARLLASMIADPKQVTRAQAEAWVSDFDSWDVCDQCCSNLFRKTEWAYAKTVEWCEREPEFEKRAGFAMIAVLAVHDKKAPDETFRKFFPFIKQGAIDNRNFVKKAVNWALRQIGKRNLALNQQAIEVALIIDQFDAKPARWIAKDALRELTSDKIQQRLKR